MSRPYSVAALARRAGRLLPRRRWRLGRHLLLSAGPAGPRATLRPLPAVSVALVPGRRPVTSLKLPLVGRLTLPAWGPRVPDLRTSWWQTFVADRLWTRRARQLAAALPFEPAVHVRWTNRARTSPGWYDSTTGTLNLSCRALSRDGERALDLVLRHLLVHAFLWERDGGARHDEDFADLAARLGAPYVLPTGTCLRKTPITGVRTEAASTAGKGEFT